MVSYCDYCGIEGVNMSCLPSVDGEPICVSCKKEEQE